MRHVLGSCKTEWILAMCGRHQELYSVNYMLDYVRRTTCCRNQHIAGGRGKGLIYVKMNISYN